MANTQTLSEAQAPALETPSGVAAKRTRVRPYAILGIVVGLAAAAYAYGSWVSRGRESTDDAQVDADVVNVAARVSGAVLKVHVADNQHVEKGALLVELDPADLAAQEKQAEAELAAARAQADAADAQVRIVQATSKGGLSAARAQLSGSTTSVASADAQIDAAKATLSRAQAEASRGEADLARSEALRKDQAIPQAELDTAFANAQVARAAVAQAQAQLAAAHEMKRTAQTQIAEAQGRVEQSAPVDAQFDAAKANADLAHARAVAAEAALTLARQQLSYTRIEAPAEGVLSRLGVREGQLMQSGQMVVAVVPSTTYAIANFKETQVGKMRPGQRAEISVDAYPGRSFEGRVESTSPGTGARFSLLPPDNASGNFVKVVQRVPVKVEWLNVSPDVKLAAGMSAEVTVHTQ
jgi:membrane fusion protein (multidrug efflux system)